MFSFDGECVYEDLRCLRNKTNMPEENKFGFTLTFSYRVNNKAKYENRSHNPILFLTKRIIFRVGG